jgi:hypothetical protein
VVIGGLVSSTLLTLLVIPTVYAWLVRNEQPAAPVLLSSDRSVSNERSTGGAPK